MMKNDADNRSIGKNSIRNRYIHAYGQRQRERDRETGRIVAIVFGILFQLFAVAKFQQENC